VRKLHGIWGVALGHRGVEFAGLGCKSRESWKLCGGNGRGHSLCQGEVERG
jgi:hypothetical protein